MAGSKMVVNEAAIQQLRRAVGAGALNAAFLVLGRAQKLTPVHGDPDQGGEFATFAPGQKPIGGTLRRSEHAAAFVDGQPVPGTRPSDGNGKSIPAYDGSGIVAYVGTNIDYARFVHDGTVKMRARPFLARALSDSIPDIPGAIAAGSRRALGQ